MGWGERQTAAGDFNDLERDVLRDALEMYGRRMDRDCREETADGQTGTTTAESVRLARRREIARDLIGRMT